MNSRNLQLATCAAVFLTGALASARPAFAERSLEPSGLALVQSIEEGANADYVVLEGGLAAGFRTGMVAVVERGSERIARLLVADATEDRAIALILEVTPGHTIQPHDRVLRSLLSL